MLSMIRIGKLAWRRSPLRRCSPRRAAQNVKESSPVCDQHGGAARPARRFMIEAGPPTPSGTRCCAHSRREQVTAEAVDALQDMPSVGPIIRTPQTLAWTCAMPPVQAGRGRPPLPDHRSSIGFREARNSRARWIIHQHPRDPPQRKGKAKARSGGSKVYVEKGELVVENWGTQPTRFNNIRPQK